MAIRGILFDIGDTLLDATKLQQRALEETVNRVAAEHRIGDTEGFIRAYKAADREPQFEETPDINHLYSDPRIITRAFQLFSQPVTPRTVERFLEVYREKLRTEIRPDAEVRAVLEELKAKGLMLGIVSNGTTEEQVEQLALMGIKELFDPILISEAVGIRKPDPEIFRRVLDSWRVSAAEVLVVGDRGDWEVVGAHRAGMKSALTTQFVDHRDEVSQELPDFIIGNLSELPAKLNAPDEAAASSQ